MEKTQLFFTGHARVCVQIHPRRQQRSPDPSDTEKTPGNAVKAFLTAIVAHEMRFEWYLRFGPTMTRRGLQSRVSAKTPPKFPLFAVHNTGRDQREEREVKVVQVDSTRGLRYKAAAPFKCIRSQRMTAAMGR